MRKMILGSLVVLSFGALLSAGCAKKDVVRTEEPISAAQPAPAQTPSTQTAPMQQARPEAESGAAQQPITETTPSREPAVAQETAKEAGQGTAQEVQAELQKVYFNFDSSDLSEEARASLSKNAEYLSRQAGVKVRIEGNCDERGSDDYNMALGERRAKSAKDYLVNLGIASDRLSTISYGEEKPAVQGHDEAAWAKNRRDEFVIVK
ncbi:Tol-Pal system peptidoglycan-associated lipoprotein PAL [Citrifermentans bremense]|uniref:Peptidoglycan-associated lipoprotein n=2 Tax=Geobacteraceae TaxID=213422 RepID=A0ABQ0MP29_9BACT|nr:MULTISPECIES: peptidoglycan-associated lipoprotein Pal [Geobacteraceae]BCG48685.1 Tol-Pal system peptidoglycan-associated lipoprotein PAL [Citrifermentans bremense]GAW68825.1 peptidoglycan-binding protein [Geoanaerobacter pelophilus]